jgi:hypothetical protein
MANEMELPEKTPQSKQISQSPKETLEIGVTNRNKYSEMP